MNEPTSHSQWNEAFSTSHELNPTPDYLGLFAYSRTPPPVCGSGLESFHWFPTNTELAPFIRDSLAWWNPAPSSMKPNEIATKVQGIVDAESADLEKMVANLNEFMRPELTRYANPVNIPVADDFVRCESDQRIGGRCASSRFPPA